MPIYGNIAGVSKDIPDWYSNIGGVSKKLDSYFANIDGEAKELLVSQIEYWRVASGSGKMGNNTRNRMVADEIIVDSNGTFTLVNPTQISGRPPANKYFVSISTSSSSSTTTGTTIYYSTNASGAYRSFSLTTGFIVNTTNISETRQGYPDIFFESNNLYIIKTLVPSLYRWTEYNVSYTYKNSYDGTPGQIAISASSNYIYISNSLVVYSDTMYSFNTRILYSNASSHIGAYANNDDSSIGSTAYVLNGSTYLTTPPQIGYSGKYTRVTDVASRGTATGRYAFAVSNNAFPTNGISGNYWYYNRTTIT